MISAIDADDIYKIPLLLHEQGLDDIVVEQAAPRRARRPTSASGSRWSARQAQPGRARSTSRMVGKYVQICATPTSR